MTRDERQVWLKSLKPGDEVYFRRGSGWSHGSILKVSKVTPTGRVSLENGCKFNNEGNYITSDKWTFGSINPVTEEIKNTLFHKKYINYLNNYDYSKLNLNQAREMYSLIKSFETKEEPN